MSGFGSLARESASNKLVEYQKIIDQINVEYNTKFEISDKAAFQNNVIIMMSSKEFERILIEEAKDFNNSEYQNNILADNEEKTTFLNVSRTGQVYERRTVPVTSGGKVGYVYASFEIIDLSSYRYFNQCTDYGNVENKSKWYFDTIRNQIRVDCSRDKCIIRYQGVWTYGPTGLTETTLNTYTVTYTP